MSNTNKITQLFPIISGICFGSAGIFVRELSNRGMDSYTIVSSRVMIAVIILFLGISFFKKDLLFIKLKDIWLFICAGVMGTLGLNICYNYSINELTLSLSAVLLSLAPVFVVFSAVLFFNEKITSKKIICMIMAIIGCVLCSGVLEASSMKWSVKGIIVGTMGAGFYALYSVFSKLAMKRGYEAFTITFYSMVAITIALFPFTDFHSIKNIISYEPIYMTVFMSLHSLFTAILPYVLYTIALNYMEAGKASILCSCEPVAATIFGILFFGEIPTILSLIGLVIVLISLTFLSLDKK